MAIDQNISRWSSHHTHQANHSTIMIAHGVRGIVRVSHSSPAIAAAAVAGALVSTVGLVSIVAATPAENSLVPPAPKPFYQCLQRRYEKATDIIINGGTIAFTSMDLFQVVRAIPPLPATPFVATPVMAVMALRDGVDLLIKSLPEARELIRKGREIDQMNARLRQLETDPIALRPAGLQSGIQILKQALVEAKTEFKHEGKCWFVETAHRGLALVASSLMVGGMVVMVIASGASATPMMAMMATPLGLAQWGAMLGIVSGCIGLIRVGYSLRAGSGGDPGGGLQEP